MLGEDGVGSDPQRALVAQPSHGANGKLGVVGGLPEIRQHPIEVFEGGMIPRAFRQRGREMLGDAPATVGGLLDGGAVPVMADGGRDHGMGGFVEADQLFPIQLAPPAVAVRAAGAGLGAVARQGDHDARHGVGLAPLLGPGRHTRTAGALVGSGCLVRRMPLSK